MDLTDLKELMPLFIAGLTTLGGAVAQTPAAMNQLNDYFRNAAPQSVKDEAASLQQRYQAYGMSPQVAQAAARMTAMTNSKNYEPGKELA